MGLAQHLIKTGQGHSLSHNGVANHRGSGVGLVLISPKRITIEKSLRLGFSTTNNEVEYKALLVRMTMVQKMGGKAMGIDRKSVV